MAKNGGIRTKELAAVFDRCNQAATHDILTPGAQRAEEAAADIESSPAASLLSRTAVSGTERPVVPARPEAEVSKESGAHASSLASRKLSSQSWTERRIDRKSLAYPSSIDARNVCRCFC